MLGEVAVAVFDHDDGSIHQHTNRKGEAAQRHDVGTDVEVVHGNERGRNGDGQGKDRNQCRAEVKQENDDDNADDDRLFE